MNENYLLKNVTSSAVVKWLTCAVKDIGICIVKFYIIYIKKTDQTLFSPSPQPNADKYINLADKFNVILCYLATSTSRLCEWNCSWIQNITRKHGWLRTSVSWDCPYQSDYDNAQRIQGGLKILCQSSGVHKWGRWEEKWLHWGLDLVQGYETSHKVISC